MSNSQKRIEELEAKIEAYQGILAAEEARNRLAVAKQKLQDCQSN